MGVAKAGAYGSLVLNANGSYTYTVDNSNAAVEALRSAASELYDTFTYTMRDTAGATSTATLSITIQGANDTATIGTPSVAVVTEDVGVAGGNLSATGTIPITDVDDHGAIFSTVVVPVGTPSARWCWPRTAPTPIRCRTRRCRAWARARPRSIPSR